MKVVVAMSGGVDSSVACLLLKKAGYDVIGIHLRLFDSKGIKCCGSQDSEEKFKKICNYIGVRYYIKDARNIFKESVIKDFVESYLNAKTPNPCVECNRFLKFEYLFNISTSLDASFIATGHYANIVNDNGNYFIERGIDKTKDQSYFLYCIKKENLNRILFPLGNYLKKEVKKIALDEKLPLDINMESKDICFIGDKSYSYFLKNNNYAKNLEGYIRDVNGKIVGKHNGYFNFTIGQRRNLGVSTGRRMYVVDIIPQKNEVIVGDIRDVCKRSFRLKKLNFFTSLKSNSKLYAQIRYRHSPSKGVFRFISENEGEFIFDIPQFAITSGQSCVFYDGNKVIGGGIIDRIIN
ncbi:MAG: tRNA 2-thiouridine(34) synthase MnmA [Elusimicrobiales bacterium]|nr:tRNA 2-thiouridine(34) synthase MnmA [Elusimicrobiales bacterium]